MCLDIHNFYLGTPMDHYEYMKMPLAHIPQEIIDEYDLNQLVHSNGHIYIEIWRGMYSISQTGILANQLLNK